MTTGDRPGPDHADTTGEHAGPDAAAPAPPFDFAEPDGNPTPAPGPARPDEKGTKLYGWWPLLVAVVAMAAVAAGLGVLWQMQQMAGRAADPVQTITDWGLRPETQTAMGLALVLGCLAAWWGGQTLIYRRHCLGRRTAPATASVLAGTLVLGTTLCFWLTVWVGGPRMGGIIQAEGPNQFANEAFGVLLRRPDPLWSMKVGPAAAAFDSSALVVAERPTGAKLPAENRAAGANDAAEPESIIGLLTASSWAGPPIDGDEFQLRVFADSFLEKIPGVDQQIETTTAIRLAGKRAVRAVVSYRDPEADLRFRAVIVFVGHKQAIMRLMVFGPADYVAAEGGVAEPFFQAVEFLH